MLPKSSDSERVFQNCTAVYDKNEFGTNDFDGLLIFTNGTVNICSDSIIK